MTKQLLSMAAILALSACASTGQQFSDQDGRLGEPALYPQFEDILDDSKLQISDPEGERSNHDTYAEGGHFFGIVNEYFYVDKSTQALVFRMKNDHLRNELRVNEEFAVDSRNKFYTLSAEIEVINPALSMQHTDIEQNEITLIQVHNKGGLPHPLLRVVWKLEREGKKGHFWAVIKNNAVICKGYYGQDNKDKPICEYENAYKLVDLGKATPGTPTAFDVTVGNTTLAIDVNGESRVSHDLYYWRDMPSYFKAGVYNQYTHGMSEAHFYKLEYKKSKRH